MSWMSRCSQLARASICFFFCIFAVHSVTEPQYVFPYSFFFSLKTYLQLFVHSLRFLGGCLPQRWLVFDSSMPRRSCRFFHFIATLLFMFCKKKRHAPILRAINIENFVFRFNFFFLSSRLHSQCTVVQAFGDFFFVHLPIDHNLRPRIFLCITRFVFCQKKRTTNHLKSSNWYGVDCF